MNNPLNCGTNILTNSGLYFDYIRPTSNMININDIAHALSFICRYNGHCLWHYSVAQHSYLVAELVYRVTKDPIIGLWGLLHDSPESYIGDMAKPLKELLPDYKRKEAEIEKVVFESFGLYGDMPPIIKEADLYMLIQEEAVIMPRHQDIWIPQSVKENLRQKFGNILIHQLTPADAKEIFLGQYYFFRG